MIVKKKKYLKEAAVAGTVLHDPRWPQNYPYTKENAMTTDNMTHDDTRVVNHPNAGKDLWPQGSHETLPSDGNSLDPRDEPYYDDLEAEELAKLVDVLVTAVASGKDSGEMIESIFHEVSLDGAGDFEIGDEVVLNGNKPLKQAGWLTAINPGARGVIKAVTDGGYEVRWDNGKLNKVMNPNIVLSKA